MSKNPEIKSIGVFCGARPDVDQKFKDLAIECGERIAKEGIKLTYGGGDSGLMGTVSDAAKTSGANVLGISTKIVSNKEISHLGSEHTYITETMFQRKEDLFKHSDAFICLPGGFGTLDEIFEIITLRYLEENIKPIIILDFEGYWQPLVKLLDHVIEHKFAQPEIRNHYHFVKTVDEAFERLGF